jgi:hypothetical protein
MFLPRVQNARTLIVNLPTTLEGNPTAPAGSESPQLNSSAGKANGTKVLFHATGAPRTIALKCCLEGL